MHVYSFVLTDTPACLLGQAWSTQYTYMARAWLQKLFVNQSEIQLKLKFLGKGIKIIIINKLRGLIKTTLIHALTHNIIMNMHVCRYVAMHAYMYVHVVPLMGTDICMF